MSGESGVRCFEDVVVSAELDGEDDDGGEDHDVEHEVLDDGDDGGSAEAGGVGVGGEDDEGGGEGPLAVDSHGGDDDADSDELEGDVGHQRENSGERDSYGEPAIAVAPGDEIGEGNVTVAVADSPKTGKDEHHVGVGESGVG